MEAGGVLCVVKSLRLVVNSGVNEFSAAVAQGAADVLCAMCTTTAGSRDVVDAGGVAVLLDAITKFSSFEGVVELACWALRLCCKLDCGKLAVIAAAGAPVLLGAVRTYANSRISAHATSALSLINESNQSCVIDE